MNSLLIVSPTLRSINTIKQLIQGTEFENIKAVGNSKDAKALIKKDFFDLCIINAPLADEEELELAKLVVTNSVAQVILFVANDKLAEISSKVEPLGIFTIPKPVNINFLEDVLKFCAIAHNRNKELLQQNKKLIRKLEDIKTVNRAKCILIEYRQMTEIEAHKYLEKCAMDNRITKRAAAENVLKKYTSSDM